MSAPKTAYKNTSLFRGNIEHLIAILQVSEATHKSRFYLDGYISVMTPDGKGGVVGYVALGSANANMHNLVRRGGGLRSLQGGQVVQLLNDGGLNTKVKPINLFSELEGVACIVTVMPSYYNNAEIKLYSRPTFGDEGVGDYIYHGSEYAVKGDGEDNVRFDAVVHDLPSGERQWMATADNSEGFMSSQGFIFEIIPDSYKQEVFVSLYTVNSLRPASNDLEITFGSTIPVDGNLTLHFRLSDNTTFTGTIFANQSYGVTYVTTSLNSGTVALNSLSGGEPLTQNYNVGTPSSLPFIHQGGVGSNITINSIGDLTCSFVDPTGVFILYFNPNNNNYYFDPEFNNSVGNLKASFWDGSNCKFYEFSGGSLVNSG